MADFLDRYGEQLQRARRRRRRRAARVSLLAVAAPVAAALVIFLAPSERDIERPAAPPTSTWTPKVGRPKVGLPATIDRTPVSRDASDVLAILRRPQTARDRKLAAPRLRHAGGAVDGVQVDGVRALNPRYALVPVTEMGDRAGPALCVMGSGGAACAPVASVREHGVTMISGGHGETRYVGVVPDGVAAVRFTPDGGRPVVVAVRENFYELRISISAPPGRVNPPKGFTGPVGKDGRIVGPPMPAQGKLEWLDAGGNVIG